MEENNVTTAPVIPVNPAFDLVAIAASAGGLQAITTVLRGLPATLPAAVVVVVHLDPQHRSLLVEILRRQTALVVKQAATGDTLTGGTVYVAPPGHHLRVTADRTLALSEAGRVGVQPSADLLFESMAASYGDRAIAVVLSGAGHDGEVGVRAMHAAGGRVIAQDQATAEFFGMPKAAIDAGSVDFVLPIGAIAPALVALVTQGHC